jgi:hypothetical protein
VALEIALRGFRGPPTRSQGREFAHYERFDVRTGGFLVVGIGSDVADVRIGERNDLAGIAWIGEYFLIAGEAGVENDFAAAARSCAGRAAVKYASVFERENRAT